MLIENNKTLGTLWTFVNHHELSDAECAAHDHPGLKEVIKLSWLELYKLPYPAHGSSEWMLAIRVGRRSFWNAFWTPQRVIERMRGEHIAKLSLGDSDESLKAS